MAGQKKKAKNNAQRRKSQISINQKPEASTSGSNLDFNEDRLDDHSIADTAPENLNESSTGTKSEETAQNGNFKSTVSAEDSKVEESKVTDVKVDDKPRDNLQVSPKAVPSVERLKEPVVVRRESEPITPGPPTSMSPPAAEDKTVTCACTIQ